MTNLIKNSFGEAQTINDILDKFKWSKFRMIWSFIYIYKERYNCYPTHYDPSEIKELLEYEKIEISTGLRQSNRPFLFMFYQNLLKENYKRIEGREIESFSHHLPKVINIISNGSSSYDRVDFLIILVDQFLAYYGEDIVKERFSNDNISFDSLWSEMDKKSKKRVSLNFIKYSNSIADSQIFHYNYV